MNSTGISQFNQARVEWAIRLRYSPMPKLSMDLLASELNAFRIGELRTVGKTWEVMMERDGELAINSEKRKADSACLEWQISSDGSPDGDKHAAALQYFYNKLSATKALDQDATGGVDELIFQTLSAVDFYYSAHEILMRVDNPAAKEVTAEFRHTPLWFFEARRGYLGYLKHIFDMYGQPCIAGEWLTAVNTGWMRQLTMPYCAKWNSMSDWLIFCRRYGSGFLEAISNATKDSQEWNDAASALLALSNEGTVLHNRDGSADERGSEHRNFKHKTLAASNPCSTSNSQYFLYRGWQAAGDAIIFCAGLRGSDRYFIDSPWKSYGCAGWVLQGSRGRYRGGLQIRSGIFGEHSCILQRRGVAHRLRFARRGAGTKVSR
jgi:hypothetical protein